MTYPNPINYKDSLILLFSRKTTNIPGPDPLVTYGFHTINEDKYSYRELFRTDFQDTAFLALFCPKKIN